jgi:hypothetical protein
MSILVINSIMGLYTSKLRAWRKVVRSSIMLFITNQLYYYMEEYNMVSSGFIIDNGVAGIIVLITIIIMFLPSVREFYTPPMYKCPPLKSWLVFLVFAPNRRGETYRFSYPDSALESNEEDVTNNLHEYMQEELAASKAKSEERKDPGRKGR